MVLWCDGGKGGVSGIAGRGMNEITQIGPGSWTRTIGLQWPFEDRRTVYARGGDFGALIIFMLLTGATTSVFKFPRAHALMGINLIMGAVQNSWRAFGEWRTRKNVTPEQGERQLLL